MLSYGVLMVLLLSAASIVGMIVFLTQYRNRRALAMIAFVATAFIVLALCESTFMGVSFVASSFGGSTP